MRRLRSTRHPRAVLTALITACVLVASLATAGGAQAYHYIAAAVAPPPAHPTRAGQIQNIGRVTSSIKAYYGDMLSGRTNPDGTAEHVPSPTSAYAAELHVIEAQAEHYLTAHQAIVHRAIVLDVDDTSLNTYNYEIDSDFTYNPVANGVFVNGAPFPAVFGMNTLANKAVALGYRVYYLTGRPETQRAATETNLEQQGFPVTDSQVFLKDLTKPIYRSCFQPPAQTCTTARYKTLTRRYLESTGADLVANFGDQYSDLRGGFADQSYKLPNPMYYLP